MRGQQQFSSVFVCTAPLRAFGDFKKPSPSLSWSFNITELFLFVQDGMVIQPPFEDTRHTEPHSTAFVIPIILILPAWKHSFKKLAPNSLTQRLPMKVQFPYAIQHTCGRCVAYHFTIVHSPANVRSKANIFVLTNLVQQITLNSCLSQKEKLESPNAWGRKSYTIFIHSRWTHSEFVWRNWGGGGCSGS